MDYFMNFAIGFAFGAAFHKWAWPKLKNYVVNKYQGWTR